MTSVWREKQSPATLWMPGKERCRRDRRALGDAVPAASPKVQPASDTTAARATVRESQTAMQAAPAAAGRKAASMTMRYFRDATICR